MAKKGNKKKNTSNQLNSIEETNNLNEQEETRNESKIELDETPIRKEHEDIGEEKDLISEKHKDRSDLSQAGSDSLENFFSESRRHNAEKLQTQITEMENNSFTYIKDLIKSGKSFIQMQRSINKTTNYIFNVLFSLFGYEYDTTIRQANLFVFATQAVIIEMSIWLESNMKDLSDEEKSNLKFSDILNKFKDCDYDEESFLNNLSVLTGNISKNSNGNVIEKSLGRIFHNALINIIKKEDLYSLVSCSQNEFEEILLNLIRRAVETTLNKESGLNLEYIKIFDEYKREESLKENKINIEEYFLRLTHGNENINKEQIKIFAECIFAFSFLKLDDILNDLKLFINNYSSIINKTKIFLSKSFYRCVYLTIKFEKFLIQIKDNALELFGEDRLRTIYAKYYNVISNVILVKPILIKNWLKESYCILNEHISKQANLIGGYILDSAIIKFSFNLKDIGLDKYNLIKQELISCYIKGKDSLMNSIYFKIDDVNERVEIYIRKETFDYIVNSPRLARDQFNFLIQTLFNKIVSVVKEDGIDKVNHFIIRSRDEIASYRNIVINKYKAILNESKDD